jgi:DtxR family Mn-dependent transcriptional regulator
MRRCRLTPEASDYREKRAAMPTPTLEEYLETIYKLSQRGPVRPTQIAEAVGVSGPTITATLRRLAAQGFTARDGNVISLTSKGLATSIDIVRRHRISERFLVDVLGLDLDEAHEDACLLEHALSPRVLAALEGFLDSPEVCPHGHPIPASDGTVAAVVGRPLSTLTAGESAVVLQLAEDDDAVLSYLTGLGVVPGAAMKVIEVAPFGGPLLVGIGDTVSAVGRDMAALVLMAPVRNPV